MTLSQKIKWSRQHAYYMTLWMCPGSYPQRQLAKVEAPLSSLRVKHGHSRPPKALLLCNDPLLLLVDILGQYLPLCAAPARGSTCR